MRSPSRCGFGSGESCVCVFVIVFAWRGIAVILHIQQNTRAPFESGAHIACVCVHCVHCGFELDFHAATHILVRVCVCECAVTIGSRYACTVAVIVTM